ncbi:hypothetical protein SNE40_003521 [Patella caerulea]|uniref:Rieske domain-containing protein n=1 Tax=Patella caerulea TaxID=87958 RepID=A0AAN8KBF1_PATCE
MQDLLYLPVQNVLFNDLFDWTDVKQKCQQTTAVINTKGLKATSNKSGSLVECNEEQIALFRHGQKVYAVKEKCPHAGGPLHLGDIEELADGSLCVKCPWHSWKFDLESGEVKFPEGHAKMAVTYKVQVKDNGQILIGFEKFSEKYFQMDNDF